MKLSFKEMKLRQTVRIFSDLKPAVMEVNNNNLVVSASVTASLVVSVSVTEMMCQRQRNVRHWGHLMSENGIYKISIVGLTSFTSVLFP